MPRRSDRPAAPTPPPSRSSKGGGAKRGAAARRAAAPAPSPPSAPAPPRRGRPRGAGRGEVVSAKRLATLAGVAPATVDTWLAAGLPAERQGNGAWEINTAAAIAWLEQRARDSVERERPTADAETMAQAELRKAVADAGVAELKLQRLRGEMVPLEEYRKELRRVLGRVRGRIAAIPGEYAPRILEPLDMPRATVLLRGLVAAVLAELQHAGDPAPGDAPGDAEAPEEGAA